MGQPAGTTHCTQPLSATAAMMASSLPARARCLSPHAVSIVLAESASQFARDLIVQLTGHTLLRERSIELIPVDAPTHFTDPTPTAEMVRQILGATSQFEKASLVAKLRHVRERVKATTGRCEGRRPVPAAAAEVRRLARKNPRTGQRRSLRAIAAGLAKLGHCRPSRNPTSQPPFRTCWQGEGVQRKSFACTVPLPREKAPPINGGGLSTKPQ